MYSPTWSEGEIKPVPLGPPCVGRAAKQSEKQEKAGLRIGWSLDPAVLAL